MAALALVGVLVPPTEGDALCYHYVVARQMGETGALQFQPIAVEWAVPMRTHALFGAGIDTNIELASIKAIVSALNRALAKR